MDQRSGLVHMQSQGRKQLRPPPIVLLAHHHFGHTHTIVAAASSLLKRILSFQQDMMAPWNDP